MVRKKNRIVRGVAGDFVRPGSGANGTAPNSERRISVVTERQIIPTGYSVVTDAWLITVFGCRNRNNCDQTVATGHRYQSVFFWGVQDQAMAMKGFADIPSQSPSKVCVVRCKECLLFANDDSE